MITQKFLESLDLPPDKAAALQDALRKDSFYREVLHRAGIMPKMVELILRTVDTSGIDLEQGDLLTEKAKIEWADFIPQRKGSDRA